MTATPNASIHLIKLDDLKDMVGGEGFEPPTLSV